MVYPLLAGYSVVRDGRAVLCCAVLCCTVQLTTPHTRNKYRDADAQHARG